MRKLNENQLQNLEAGKFWGKSCGNEQTGECTVITRCNYYAFWLVMDSAVTDIRYVC